MPPFVASCLTATGVVCLLVRDLRQNRGESHALWIPLLWLMIIASRMPSEWLSGGVTIMSSGAEYVDGSPLDRNIFLLLMVAGVIVLMRRSISWGEFTTTNIAVTFFFVFTFISILWSDFPLVAFKRWHKVFGHVIMVLVVLTDREPGKAFATMLRRCGFVLLPYSVLYIKYYPELGRSFDGWTGAATNTGITTNKNALANLCQITGLYFVAAMFVKANGKRFVRGLDLYISIAFLYMVGWLLMMAESSTATVATALGAAVIVAFRSSFVRRHFTTLMLTASLVAGLAYAFTNIKDVFLDELGEDATLTGRTELWEDLRQVDINPLIGVGFESFWLGDRLTPLWNKYWWHPNQAHNGYFEMYLNLGWIGEFVLLAMIVAGYRHARRHTLSTGPPPDVEAALTRGLAEFRLAFVLSVVAYNFTEATFKALHPSFFLFFMASVDYGSKLISAPVTSVHPEASPDPRHASFGQSQPHEAAAALNARPSVAGGAATSSGSVRAAAPVVLRPSFEHSICLKSSLHQAPIRKSRS